MGESDLVTIAFAIAGPFFALFGFIFAKIILVAHQTGVLYLKSSKTERQLNPYSFYFGLFLAYGVALICFVMAVIFPYFLFTRIL